MASTAWSIAVPIAIAAFPGLVIRIVTHNLRHPVSGGGKGISYCIGMFFLTPLLIGTLVGCTMSNVPNQPPQAQGAVFPTQTPVQPTVTQDSSIIRPTTAWLVETIETDLGTLEQTLLSDVTSRLDTQDSNWAVLEGSAHQVDVDRRQELYLFFAADKIQPDLNGFLVVGLKANDTGRARIDAINLRIVSSDRLQLKVQGESSLHLVPWAYYAHSPMFETIGRASDGEIVRKWTKTSLLPFENDFISPLPKRWKRETTSHLNSQVVPGLYRLYVVSQTLLRFDSEFGQIKPRSDLSNLWLADRISEETVAELVEDLSKQFPTVRIYVRFRYPHSAIDYGDDSLRYDFTKEYVVADGDAYYPALIAIRAYMGQ